MLFSLWSVFTEMRSESKAIDTFVLFQLFVFLTSCRYSFGVTGILSSYFLLLLSFLCVVFSCRETEHHFHEVRALSYISDWFLSVLACVWKLPASSMPVFNIRGIFFFFFLLKKNINRWNHVLHWCYSILWTAKHNSDCCSVKLHFFVQNNSLVWAYYG